MYHKIRRISTKSNILSLKRLKMMLENLKEFLIILKNLFVEPNPVPAKSAMKMLGMIADSHVRLPLCEMRKENEALVRQTLVECGLLK